MIIACDYDNTLMMQPEGFSNSMGKPNYPLIEKLIKLKEKGHQIILWTCREGEWLQEAVEECKSLGLEFDAVNESLPDMKSSNCGLRKVIADLYIDDRSCLPEYFLNIIRGM